MSFKHRLYNGGWSFVSVKKKKLKKNPNTMQFVVRKFDNLDFIQTLNGKIKRCSAREKDVFPIIWPIPTTREGRKIKEQSSNVDANIHCSHLSLLFWGQICIDTCLRVLTYICFHDVLCSPFIIPCYRIWGTCPLIVPTITLFDYAILLNIWQYSSHIIHPKTFLSFWMHTQAHWCMHKHSQNCTYVNELILNLSFLCIVNLLKCDVPMRVLSLNHKESKLQ